MGLATNMQVLQPKSIMLVACKQRRWARDMQEWCGGEVSRTPSRRHPGDGGRVVSASAATEQETVSGAVSAAQAATCAQTGAASGRTLRLPAHRWQQADGRLAIWT